MKLPFTQVIQLIILVVTSLGAIACVIPLIYFGITLVEPYNDIQKWVRQDGGAHVISNNLTHLWLQCNCGDTGGHGCRSTYQCLQIQVRSTQTNMTSQLYLTLGDIERNNEVSR